ncbi:hypothetical protein Taro_028264 [Colocasia esculenta]|uniref:Uncharacterized protein n=1 Tax=Colocasia esculenta TaxID=4460 RepID=A0A843VGU3_COLES|nr:hypothetical protein [Colocasia esculenta]
MHFQLKSENNKGEDEPTDIVPFYKLFKFADSLDTFLIITGAIAAVANGASTPLMMGLFGDLINSFGETTDKKYVVHGVSKTEYNFNIHVLSEVALLTVAAERQAARIRNLYMKSILRQDITFFDKNNVGEVVGNMSGDTILIQDAMGEKIGKLIQLVSSFLGGFVVAFSHGWLLALVMLSTIPLLVLSTSVMSTVISKMASHGQAAYSEAAIIAEQSISSIRTVASFTREKQVQDRYDKSLKNAYKASVHEGLAAGIGLGSAYCIVFFGYALGIWFGSKMILNNGYTGGRIITVIFALLTGSFSLGQASPCISAFAAGRVAASKMFVTIDRKPEIDASSASGKKLDDIRGDIEFKNVYFSYPARPEEQIFSGFSLLIPSSTTTALVGESGSGKSTVVSLIERFYDPQAGEVLIDGVKIKEFQLRWIRRKIGLVSQEPVLFSCSIRDNIAYGKDDATGEEIKAACELANASKFIDKMPQGLDTMVGEHGIQLSGGQKQRIAIARAVLKNPRILLLDEATSALDVESERTVQDALERAMANRTTILVAHRLTTIKNADLIAVLHRGSIIEKGSHSQLLANPNGAYYRLVCLQKVNQDSNQHKLPDQNDSLLDGGRQSSQCSSFQRSISVGSSGGNSSRNSFSIMFGLPVEIDIQENRIQGPENEKPLQQPQKVYIWRLAYLNKPELLVILLGVVAAVVNGVILPIFGMLLSSIIHTFYGPPNMLSKHSRFWSILFLVLGSVSLVAIPARSYCFAVAGSKLIERIRSMTFSKVVHMEIEWFDEPQNTSGVIGARLSGDAAAVRSLVGDTLALIVQNLATLIAGMVIAFTACWQLALIMLALVPLIGLNGWIQMKFMKGVSANAKVMFEEASQIANEAVGNMRTVASFSAEDKVMKIYEEKCDDPVKLGIRQGFINGIGFGFSFLLVFCAYALSFYSGSRLIEYGETQFTNVFRVFFALNLVAVGISQSSSLLPDATKAGSAADSIFTILDRESKINADNDLGIKLQQVHGSIEFQHVSFCYPTRPDVQIFEDFCLAIEPGKTVALVGESGSGKSSAISLLQRFYDPDSGKILLDGVEIQDLQLRWLRQQMGLVSQEPALFNDTIRANIACGKEGEATEAEIMGAAESANAHKFISGLQQGYETMVGERGIQLSGGQKQRIAITRAIIKEPKILLLDEATSALDAESEQVVQETLDQIMVNRTTIVIAHRLSTIRGADLIAVVRNGVIVEKGKHEALMNIEDGVYASLVALHQGAS